MIIKYASLSSLNKLKKFSVALQAISLCCGSCQAIIVAGLLVCWLVVGGWHKSAYDALVAKATGVCLIAIFIQSMNQAFKESLLRKLGVLVITVPQLILEAVEETLTYLTEVKSKPAIL
uniref:Uncharacterized protein n=1 Tax=Glossina austeni TaxID=7395 RepID=A0A1A9USH5_GLOAU